MNWGYVIGGLAIVVGIPSGVAAMIQMGLWPWWPSKSSKVDLLRARVKETKDTLVSLQQRESALSALQNHIRNLNADRQAQNIRNLCDSNLSRVIDNTEPFVKHLYEQDSDLAGVWEEVAAFFYGKNSKSLDRLRSLLQWRRDSVNADISEAQKRFIEAENVLREYEEKHQ